MPLTLNIEFNVLKIKQKICPNFCLVWPLETTGICFKMSKSACYSLNICVLPPQIHVLIPIMVVLRGWAFGEVIQDMSTLSS